MKKLKRHYNVWMSGPDDPGIRPLVALLKEYGIGHTAGWMERVAHPHELFPIGQDYRAAYTVSFDVPNHLRTDVQFRQRLRMLVF